MARVVARRNEGLANRIDVGGRHQLAVDEPPEHGGADGGPQPTELLAASLAGCTAITVEMYAARKGWDVGQLEVAVETEFDGPVPNSFAVALTLPPELDDEQRQRLLTIAGRCPVHRAIAGQTPVTVSERVEER